MGSVHRPDWMTPVEWICHHIDIDDNGCWIWKRSKAGGRYGQISVDGTMRPTHRVTYEAIKGPIPDGLVIDHLCRVHLCCNPEHLRAVTQKVNSTENVADTIGWKLNLAKTHCPRGHPYEGHNLVVKRGHRHCRECELAQSRDYYRRHADEIRAQKSARRAATKQKAEAT